MKKNFKNSFGVQSDNLNLLKAFIQEAEAIGWQHQETDYSALDQTHKLYFGGNDVKYDLKPNHFWTCNSYLIPTTRYDLPSEWNQALEAASEVVKPSIQIGDYVKITNEGLVYSTHSRMFRKLGFRNTVENSGAECSGLLGKVFAVDAYQVALDLENGNQLLIGKDGIVKVEATEEVEDRFILKIKKGDWVTCLPGGYGGYGRNEDLGNYAGAGYKGGLTFKISRVVEDDCGKGNIAYGGVDNHGVWAKFLRKATEEEITAADRKEVIEIGLKRLDVVVTKGGAIAEGHDLDMDSLRSLYSLMLDPKKVLDSLKCHWPIHISKINIGCCEDVTRYELKNILDAYDSFQ